MISYSGGELLFYDKNGPRPRRWREGLPGLPDLHRQAELGVLQDVESFRTAWRRRSRI